MSYSHSSRFEGRREVELREAAVGEDFDRIVLSLKEITWGGMEGRGLMGGGWRWGGKLGNGDDRKEGSGRKFGRRGKEGDEGVRGEEGWIIWGRMGRIMGLREESRAKGKY